MLADLRGRKPEESRETAAAIPARPHERAHPGPLEYVQIALLLGAITAVEVAVYYLGISREALVAMLLIMSAVKFSLVAMWYMHLRFDSRWFSTAFVGGLLLAAAVFIVVLVTLHATF